MVVDKNPVGRPSNYYHYKVSTHLDYTYYNKLFDVVEKLETNRSEFIRNCIIKELDRINMDK